MSDFTPEQVERTAEALWNQAEISEAYKWGDEPFARWRDIFLAKAHEVLSAAGAPEKVAPARIGSGLTDVIELAKFLDRHEPQLIQEAVYVYQGRCSCGHYSPRLDHGAHVATELAAYLRGESK